MADIQVKSNEQLHTLIEMVEKHQDKMDRTFEDINAQIKKVDTKADAEELVTLRQSVVNYKDNLDAIRERMDTLDKILPYGNKVYGSATPTQTSRSAAIRDEIAKTILDGACRARNERPRFGSEFFNRSQIEDTAADGGYLFNPEFRAEVMRIVESYGVARRLCKPIQMRGKEWTVPTNSVLPSVYWDTEIANGTSTDKELKSPDESNVPFGQKTMTAHKLIAIDTLSIELSQDSLVDVGNFILDLFGISIAKEEDYQCLMSPGTGNEPFTGLMNNSVITASPLAVVGADSTFLGCLTSVDEAVGGYASLVKMFDAADERSTDTGTIVLSNSVLNGMRLVRTTTGEPLFQGIAGASTTEAFGRPIVRSRVMPKLSDGSQTGKAFVLFGDFSNQLMGDRMQLTFDSSTHAAFKEAGVVLRVMERIGFMTLFNTPFSCLKAA